MQPDLELLLKLQVIDYDLGELERSKEYLPDMMENLQREIGEAQEKFEAATKSLEESRIEQKNLELQIKSKEADLQKFQQQMMSIKTNKEYDALVAEIDNVKATISDSESRLLEVMEQIATLEKEVPELEKKSQDLQETNTRQLSILQEKVDSIGDKMSAKEEERKSVVDSIPRQTKSIYERVRRGRGGAPVVVVKKRACSSCHKALTPKKVQEIKKGDRIHTCENCGVLLYWDIDVSD